MLRHFCGYVVAACLAACGDVLGAGGEEFVVAPGALSPHDALLKIRAAKLSGDRSAWTVRVKPGFYELREPLVFRPEDSGTPSAPVTWVAEGGEAVFAGGGEIAGWRDEGDGTWSAPLPKDADGRPAWFQTLYANGRRAVRARHPNTGFFQVDAWHQTAVTNADGVVTHTQHAVISNAVADALAGLPAAERAAVELQSRIKWSYGAVSVAGWEPSSRELTACTYKDGVVPWKVWADKNNLFSFENVRAGFDAPGEWFYDVTAGRVRYRPLPGETLSAFKALAPTAGLVSVVRFEGEPEKGRAVTDISLEGITFALSHTGGDRLAGGFVQQYHLQGARETGGCVYARGAVRLAFDRCKVNRTENYAFRFDVGCVSNRVVNCEMTDLGAGGVMIGDTKGNYYRLKGVPATEPFPAREIPYGDPMAAPYHPCAFIAVDNCLIERTGMVNPEGVGVLIMQASDCSVTHCDIRDLHYTGVSVGWTWGYSGSLAQRNTIAFNRISGVGQGVMCDLAGIYTLGASFGTCISNNVVCGVRSFCYGGVGLYADEGSEGIVWENNLVCDTKEASCHQHYGRNNVYRNNIFACAERCQLTLTRAEPHRSMTFDRNIVYWEDDVPAYKDPDGYRAIVDGTARVDWTNNVFWCASGATVVNAPHPAVVADPLFVDAKARDFRLKPDSPALRFGFKPWDLSQPGRKIAR